MLNAVEETASFTRKQILGIRNLDADIAQRQSAVEYLSELEKAGILKSRKMGKENLYLNAKLYDLLSK